MRLSALILTIMLPASLYAQDPTDIIMQYFDTVSGGDINNWKSVRSAYIEGLVVYSQSNFDTKSTDHSEQKPSTYKSYWAAPDKSRFDLFTDSVMTMSTFHVGDTHTFILKDMLPMPAPIPNEYESQFEPLMVKNVVDRKKRISLSGIEKIDDTELYNIQVTTKDMTWHFYINTRTYLLEFWSNAMGDTQPASLTKVFQYKRFGKFLVPTRESKRTKGGEFFWNTRQKIDLDVAIDEKVFQLP